VAAAFGMSATELIAGCQRRPVAHARTVPSLVAVTNLGLPAAGVVRPQA